jgi:multimeric flavodoxin WrbA
MEAYAPVQRLTVDPETLHPAKRTLVLNGALPGDETLEPVEEELFALLRDARTEIRGYSMRDIPLAHCQGCFECWTTSPGLCKTHGDAGREIAAAMVRSDLMVALTPITFGGYSSEIKKAMDRVICVVLPFFRRVDGEVHHARRYSKYPALAAVGVLQAPDEEEERIFRALVQRNALNMDSPATAVCVLPAGAPPEVIRGRLAEDLEPVLAHVAGRVS